MPIRPRRIFPHALVALLFVLACVTPARPASALPSSRPLNATDPMAIISLVNALRATQGLPPYIVDQGLMDYALEHSRYQASLHTATHQHSDGSTVWQNGMDENIATGMLGMLTPEYAVYTVWSDAIHMKTMIGYATGYVGAGVADDGADEYYTLNVRPGSAVARPDSGTGGRTDPNATPTKIIPIVPLLTVTPRGDRWIIHTVGYGQSLWAVAIAYGVKMDQIRDWNSMAAESTEIYAGQKLYIIAPANIWPTLTASPVGSPATVEAGQTVTPGYLMTEEPSAATAKAVYQTAAAQTQVSELGVPAAQGTALAVAEATAPQAAAPEALLPQAQATVSPPVTEAPGAPVIAEAAAAQPDNLLLTAGMLILLGGGLLVMFALSLRRKA